MVDKPLVRNTVASFDAAENNLEEIITRICQHKWEKEVLQSKLLPFSTEIVIKNIEKMEKQHPDLDEMKAQFDHGDDVEPESIEPDFYQTDKLKLKIRYRDPTAVQREYQVKKRKFSMQGSNGFRQ